MSAALQQDEPGSALAVIPSTAISTIAAADTSGILASFAAKVRAFRQAGHDVSKPQSRDAMRSLAAEGRSTKASLLRLAKGLKDDALKTQRAINAEERIVENRMDELIVDIRAPLTAWENVEKERVAGHEAAMRVLELHGEMVTGQPDEIRNCLTLLDTDADRDWQEFRDRASDMTARVRDKLTAALVGAEKREAEAAELARLRAENEARQRAEAARIAADEQARITAEAVRAAEERAQREAKAARIKAEQEAAAAIARVEQQRLDAEAAAERERGAAAARERQAIADREAAERRAQEAEEAGRRAAENARLREEQARAEAEVRRVREAAEAEERQAAAERRAVEQERQRAEREADERRAEEERRAADKAHRGKLNNEALTVLVEKIGLSAPLGKAVIAAIAKGEVPHISIRY